MSIKTFTKESLITELVRIKKLGWIEQKRSRRNAGAIGNTLEDLLGIKENNLPLPNASEWELKTQRKDTNSLLTLFHMEPPPTALKIVNYLLQNFGWAHKQAGKRYPASEMSFRQTLSYREKTIRGFFVDIDRENKKILVDFDFNSIDSTLEDWKRLLLERGTIKLSKEYRPYWGFSDLFHKAGTKLKNCFFVIAEERKEANVTYIKYDRIIMLSGFNFNHMLEAIRNRDLYIDFDARTGHNHGTKFRLRSGALPKLYEEARIIE